MPEVELFAGLRDAVEGAKSVQVEGTTIRELLQNIAREYPSLHKRIEQGVAVAIDGDIYRDDWDQPIPEGAEVVLLIQDRRRLTPFGQSIFPIKRSGPVSGRAWFGKDGSRTGPEMYLFGAPQAQVLGNTRIFLIYN